MEDYPFEKLKERYDALPSDIRKVISSADVGQTIQAIGQKHNLHIDVIEKLFDQTGLVMLGLSRPENFVENLRKILDVDAPTAAALAQEINDEIFLSIRESLKHMHESAVPAVPAELALEIPPSREDVLKNIESPLPTAPRGETQVAPQTIFEQKTKTLVDNPRRENYVDPYREGVE